MAIETINDTNVRGTGGEILVDALRRQGADNVFCVPGESYLAALDAFYDVPEIKLTVCRQEGGAAMMAGTYGRMTNTPGICFVTRGPGATNASAGVHIAWQDCQPMILLIGQVPREEFETDAFQEVDFRQMFGPMAKWVGQIDDARRIPEYISRAYHIATSGRPGPVVIALPEDMLVDVVEAPALTGYLPVETAPSDTQLEELRKRLQASERPLAIIGGAGWTQEASDDFKRFAHAWQIPVGTAFRCQDVYDNEDEFYAGDCGTTVSPDLRQHIEDADLLLVAGARSTHLTSPFKSLLGVPRTSQYFVHAFPGPEELGALTRPDLAVHATMPAFARSLAQMSGGTSDARAGWSSQVNQNYRRWSTPIECPGDVQMAQIIASVRDQVDDDAVFTVGAGNYTMWVHRFVRTTRVGSQLGPMSGSMGFSTPAAIAAKTVHPERTVIALVGDGCFMMTGQELSTAVQYDLAIIWIVVNNNMYGTIRMHQERDYPTRISATALKNPDFAALARASGAAGFTVTRTEEFQDAFDAARAANGPALIEVQIDPDAISTVATLSGIRKAALEAS